MKKLITPEAFLSFPHIAEPTVMTENGKPKGEPKYSASLLFAPGTDVSALHAAALEAAEEMFGSKAASLIKSGAIVSPFRTDAAAKGYPEGTVFINVRSTQQPGVVYPHRGADGKPAVVAADDITKVFYPGAKVRASITAFAYNYEGMKKGVSFGLNNLQKLGDGPRLDGRVAAEDEFEATQELAPASLDDVGA